MSWMDDGAFSMRILSDGSDRSDHSAQVELHLACGHTDDYILTKTDVQRVRRECNRILKQLDKKKERQ